MRTCCVILLIAIVGAMLSGCSLSQEVEHQAYALVLGIDRTPDGTLEAAVRIPKIGQSKPSEGGQSEESSPYLLYTARGVSFTHVLDGLRMTVPRDLNLSHITLLVVSESLAAEADFGNLLRQIAETPHLYTNARFVVCAGSALDFVRGQKVVIGTRLSADIDAMFQHHADLGIIPDTNLAEVYFAAYSVYSDPAAIWGFMAPERSVNKEAAALVGSSETMDDSTAPVRQCYEGAAVFAQGRLALRLDARETLLMNLILGRQSAFTLEHEGRSYTLTPRAKPGVRVDVDGSNVIIHLKCALSSIDAIDQQASDQIETALASAMEALIEKCQAHGVEPFNFAERAAEHFTTGDAWLSWNWRARFAEAQADVRVSLNCSPDNL